MQSTDPTSTTPAAAPPQPRVDPNAPVTLKLPSGKVVELRSHRTLLGADGEFALNAQSGTGNGYPEIRTALVARMATELEPGTAGTPVLDGTIEGVRAQRLDDYRAMYGSPRITEAYLLVMGVSVIPDLDTWEDEAGPTKDSNASPPGSEAESPS
jgi:hypothetical protein